jgi:hypothetical protein
MCGIPWGIMRTVEGKNWRLTVTVNKAQRDFIVARARNSAMSVSEYLRDLIGRALRQDGAPDPPESDPPESDSFLDELIG